MVTYVSKSKMSKKQNEDDIRNFVVLHSFIHSFIHSDFSTDSRLRQIHRHTMPKRHGMKLGKVPIRENKVLRKGKKKIKKMLNLAHRYPFREEGADILHITVSRRAAAPRRLIPI